MVCAVKEICPECPFSRKVQPGALGGSHPFVYIGQALGPFVLPCHMHCDFDDPKWREESFVTPQCKGAVIFRANIGAQMFMPPSFPRAEKNLVDVFASPSEFLAHHLQIPLKQAYGITSSSGFYERVLNEELAKQEVIRKEPKDV